MRCGPERGMSKWLERLTLMVTVCKPENRASVPTSVLLPQACHAIVNTYASEVMRSDDRASRTRDDS